MHVTPYVIILSDRQEAERLESTVYTSIQELRDILANDGIDYDSVICLSDFMDDWNNCDDDDSSMVNILRATFISYVYVCS